MGAPHGIAVQTPQLSVVVLASPGVHWLAPQPVVAVRFHGVAHDGHPRCTSLAVLSHVVAASRCGLLCGAVLRQCVVVPLCPLLCCRSLALVCRRACPAVCCVLVAFGPPTKTFLLLLCNCINMYIGFPSAAFGGSSVCFCCRTVPCHRHWSVSPVAAWLTVHHRRFLRCPRSCCLRCPPTVSHTGLSALVALSDCPTVHSHYFITFMIYPGVPMRYALSGCLHLMASLGGHFSIVSLLAVLSSPWKISLSRRCVFI